MEKRRSTRKVLYVLGGLATLCFGSGLIVTLVTGLGPYDLPAKARMLDEAIAESKRLGLPMTAAELAGPRPPDDQNAAIEAIPLAKKWASLGSKVVNQYPWNEESERAFAQLLEEHGQDLDRYVVVVTSKPEWYVDREYDLGPNLLLPEMADIKNVAKVLARRAELRAEAGDVQGAVSDLTAILATAQHVSDEPFMIGMLVAIAIDSIGLRSVERVVAETGFDAQAIAEIEALVLRSGKRFDPRPALEGEFYMALNVCRNFHNYGGYRFLKSMSEDGIMAPPVNVSELKREGLPNDVFSRANLTTFAQYWNGVFARLAKQEAQARDWSEAMVQFDAKIQTRNNASEVMAKVLLPVFAQADKALVRDDANKDLALAFTRCIRFRAENGRFPRDLNEITSAFDDPFNPGSSIRMSSTPNELRVWSVGMDGKDDDGFIGYLPHKPSEEAPRRSDDLVFIWPSSLRTTQN